MKVLTLCPVGLITLAPFTNIKSCCLSTAPIKLLTALSVGSFNLPDKLFFIVCKSIRSSCNSLKVIASPLPNCPPADLPSKRAIDCLILDPSPSTFLVSHSLNALSFFRIEIPFPLKIFRISIAMGDLVFKGVLSPP